MFNIPRGALITLLFLGAMSIPVSAAHAVNCGAGKRPVTDQEVKTKGFPAGSCTDENTATLTNGGCDYNPYEMLLQKWAKGRDDITPQGGNTGGINMALACRLTKFFKAVEEKGCSVKIISGYRSAAKQSSMCGAGRTGCAAGGRSCHQYGLAVDVASSCIGWMRAAAPQFKLGFPYYGPHIQCAEHRVAACSPQTPPCDGSAAINPDLSNIPPPNQIPNTYFSPPQGGNPNITDDGIKPPTSQSSPLAPLTNAIRNLLNPQPQQQPAQQPATTTPQTPPSLGTVNSTPYPAGTCATQYHCVSTAIYYRAGTCVDSVYQQCPYGCANSQACATATSTATTTSDTTNTPTVTSNPELDRLLENLGQATTTTGPVGTVVSVVSPGSLKDLGTQAGVIAPSVSPQLPDMTPVTVLEQAPVPATQTFSPTPTYETGTSQRSVFSAALGDMQIALQRLLIFLQPFRGRYPGEVY